MERLPIVKNSQKQPDFQRQEQKIRRSGFFGLSWRADLSVPAMRGRDLDPSLRDGSETVDLALLCDDELAGGFVRPRYAGTRSRPVASRRVGNRRPCTLVRR